MATQTGYQSDAYIYVAGDPTGVHHLNWQYLRSSPIQSVHPGSSEGHRRLQLANFPNRSMNVLQEIAINVVRRGSAVDQHDGRVDTVAHNPLHGTSSTREGEPGTAGVHIHAAVSRVRCSHGR